MASHPKTGLNVSVTLEKSPGPASTSECVRHLQQLQKGPFVSRGQDVNLNTTGTLPTLEYTLRELQGIRLDQKNMYACLAKDNVYADLHLSKVQYTPTDVPLFQSLLKTVHFQQGTVQNIQVQAPATQNSLQLFRMGSAWYLQNKYDQAIPPYQKAFDLEKAQPQLDKTLWRVLVDNLGMAYGMTGRLNEAKATFEQGIQADPTYPMFHYNLACTYAEMNDLDHATQSLKAAFQYRKNQNAGESMPDPRQDSSFQRFMKHDAFRKLVNDLLAMKS
jgi:tetratricopeptide (TPR) repeat protein